MRKRLIALLLTVTLGFGMLPVDGSAEQTAPPNKSNEVETRAGYIQPVELLIDELPVFEPSDEVESTGAHAASEWDTYASNYYYNLMSDAERQFYDALDDLAYSYLTTTRNAYQNGIMEGVICENLSLYDARNVWNMFRISNPQYYFLLPAYVPYSIYGVNVLYMAVYPKFINGSERYTATLEFKSELDAWVDEVLKETDTIAREKKIHDLIVETVDYDEKYYLYNEERFWEYECEEGYTQSCYSVLVKEPRTTVCAGYSMAFELLCNAVGIENISVTSEAHQWNRVRLNGSWYNVDCTWDDADDGWYYDYFNRSSAAINDIDGYHIQENIYDKYMNSSVCVLDSGATEDDIGEIDPAKGTAAAPTITSTSTGSGMKITISSPTANAKIYYTTDGTTPTVSAMKSRYYNAPFTISKSMTVKAIAVYDAYLDSAVTSNAVSCYVVTFNSQGGSSVAAKYVSYNTAVSQPAAPTRTGYTFGGWYTNAACTTAWNFAAKVTSDKTLYAKWTENQYTITYNLNKGKNSTKNPKTYTITTNVIKLQNPTRTGYIFKGWYKDAKFKTKVTQIKKGSTGKVTLYAKWENVSTPKQTTVSKLTNKSGKKLSVTINKVSGADGYEIRYATKSSMKGAKKVTASSNKKTFGGLSKKTYYVQARAYKIDSTGKRYYGTWSQKKSITITK